MSTLKKVVITLVLCGTLTLSYLYFNKTEATGIYNNYGSFKPLIKYPQGLFKSGSDSLKTPGIEKTNFDFGSREWRIFYPEIDTLLFKIEQGIIPWPKNIKDTTLAEATKVQIINKGSYKIGDSLNGLIIARDHNGKSKRYGGDYFRARLLRIGEKGEATYDGIPCQIVDHGNGTYGISARLLWEGMSRLVVELIHPSESVVQLIQNTTRSEGKGVNFEGTFPSDTKTFCNIGLSLENPPGDYTEICDFSNNHTGVAWYCFKPHNENCATDLKWIDRVYDKPNLIELGKSVLYQRNVNWQTLINGSGYEFEVFPSQNGIIFNKLPECKVDDGMKNSLGLFRLSYWTSLQCSNIHFDMRYISKCLSHSIVYVIGDSTMRQWYYKLVSALHLRDSGADNSHIWQNPRTGRNDATDVTVFYRAHGPPLFNPGPPSSRPHIVSTLDGIQRGSKNVAVVLNEGLHLLLYDPQFYISRLKAVKSAIIRLKHRVPNAKVLIRGAIRHFSTDGQCPSEWLSFRHNKILKGVFSSIPGVGFIDTWEMTTVHPQENVHPNDQMVTQNVALFLSYICPTIKKYPFFSLFF